MFAMWACVTFPLTVLGGIIGQPLSEVGDSIVHRENGGGPLGMGAP